MVTNTIPVRQTTIRLSTQSVQVSDTESEAPRTTSEKTCNHPASIANLTGICPVPWLRLPTASVPQPEVSKCLMTWRSSMGKPRFEASKIVICSLLNDIGVSFKCILQRLLNLSTKTTKHWGVIHQGDKHRILTKRIWTTELNEVFLRLSICIRVRIKTQVNV